MVDEANPDKFSEVDAVEVVVQFEAAEVLYCTLYDEAPLTADQLMVADVVVIDDAPRPAGVPQDVPPEGGTQPREEVKEARAPPAANTAFIRAD